MGFGLKSPKRQDLARPVPTARPLSSYLSFGLFIPLFAFNLPFSMTIQRSLPPNCMLLSGAFCQTELSVSSAPKPSFPLNLFSMAVLFNPLLCRLSRSSSKKRVEELSGASTEDQEKNGKLMLFYKSLHSTCHSTLMFLSKLCLLK